MDNWLILSCSLLIRRITGLHTWQHVLSKSRGKKTYSFLYILRPPFQTPLTNLYDFTMQFPCMHGDKPYTTTTYYLPNKYSWNYTLYMYNVTCYLLVLYLLYRYIDNECLVRVEWPGLNVMWVTETRNSSFVISQLSPNHNHTIHHTLLLSSAQKRN
jgi:hypothetical protein